VFFVEVKSWGQSSVRVKTTGDRVKRGVGVVTDKAGLDEAFESLVVHCLSG
jgi:hypothetical protein